MASQTTMHYVIDLDPAGRIVRVTVDGVLTDELLMETYGTLERLVSGKAPYSGIFDFSKVIEDLVSSEGITDLARKAAIILSGKPPCGSGQHAGSPRTFSHVRDESRWNARGSASC